MKFNKQTDDFPETFHVFIEISAGSNMKYEYDEELEGIKLDRILFTSMVYPTNYGFAINTKGKDGDPLDVLVISSNPILPGIAVKCRPVGIGLMEDEEGEDNKIIAVPVDKVDAQSSIIRDQSDIPGFLKDKLKHFFEHYKELEKGKFMKFNGFGGKDDAIKELNGALLKN